ncbi:MAG: hypothetical protein GY906_21740 [bacterium]|nr:hypothetical protein [bacterium]
MSQTQVQLKGWPAVAVIAAVVVFFGFKVFIVHSTLGPEELDGVRLWLQAEYSSMHIDDLREAVENSDKAKVNALAGEIQAAEKIEFVSIKMRGTDEVVVRLEIEVDGQDPPRGDRVRYFILDHTFGSAWHVERETSSWSYYLKLF